MSNIGAVHNFIFREIPTVLIVSGSEEIRSSLSFFLERSGYRIIVATDGEEGLDLYDRERPAIVLVDIELDHVSGVRFVSQLHEKYINIPVVVISGEPALPVALEAVRRGAWDYLVTPVNELKLDITIKRALEWVRMLGENIRYREQLEDEVQTKTRELRNGQERYQRLLESVTNYVYTVSFDKGKPAGIVHQSACEKVTGYTPEDYNTIPDLWYRIVHDDDRPQVSGMAKRILTETKSLKLEHRIHHKDGSQRWIRSTLVPYRDSDGVLLAYDGIISDITDRKLAEIQLRESEERFSQLFLQHEDAIILFRLETFEIIDANPAAISLYGYSRSELLSTFPWPFVGDDHDGLREALYAALGENSRFDLFRLTQIRKDGTPVVVSMRGNLVTVMDDKVVYCSVRDISEKIRLEDKVRDTQAKLIQVNEMASLGMLASGIAHEINNPNNFILFNSSLLAETWLEVQEKLEEHAAEHGDFYLGGRPYSEVREETPRLIAGLAEGARRIQAIIETMKGAVRQGPDNFEACIDVNKTVQMAMTLLSHEIRKHGRSISVELCNDLPHVLGKPQLIEQVIINLVTNALNAVVDNDGGIRIMTLHEQADDFVTITVQDDGVGMTGEVLDRISEPFFTTRFDQGGTGLGVSISLSIIKEHNGTLTYHSEPGSGTTATVRLPVSDCAPTSGTRAEETA